MCYKTSCFFYYHGWAKFSVSVSLVTITIAFSNMPVTILSDSHQWSLFLTTNLKDEKLIDGEQVLRSKVTCLTWSHLRYFPLRLKNLNWQYSPKYYQSKEHTTNCKVGLIFSCINSGIQKLNLISWTITTDAYYP